MSWEDDIQRLLERRLGHRASACEQRPDLRDRVRQRATTLGLSVEAYVSRLEESGDPRELRRLVPSYANGYTWFFRDPEQLDSLAQMATHLHRRLGRPLHIWSAGCSTGEEPYSIAIRCAQEGVPAAIVGTDVNVEALHHASRGRYAPWSLRHVPEAAIELGFHRQGGHRHITPSIARTVSFQEHNLLDHPPLPPRGGKWDLITCRNVFIYWEQDALRRAARALANALAPHGLLFIAASDLLHPATREGTGLEPVEEGKAFRRGDGPRRPLDRMREPLRYQAAPPVPEPATSDDDEAPTYAKAVELARAGCIDQATMALESWLERQPGHHVAWLTLGNLRASRHELEGALDAYVRAEALAPLDPEVHLLEGIVLRKLGALERAVASLRRAAFLAPDLWPARLLMAGVWERLGQTDRARIAREEILRMLPRVGDAPLRSFTRGLPGLELSPEAARRACAHPAAPPAFNRPGSEP